MITLGNLGSMAAWVYVIIQQDEPIRHRMLNLDTDDSTWMVELLVTNYES